MAKVNMTLSVRQRRWFGPAFSALSFVCAIVSIVSMHAANWLPDKGTSFLARHGVVLAAE